LLPQIERKPLLNGMQFLFFEGNEERVPFLLMIKNGAAFDPSGKWGATNLLLKMMIEGTTDQVLQRELGEREIEFDYFVDWDAIHFSGTAPAEHLSFALSTLSDLLVRPVLEEAMFERLRAQAVEEAKAERSGLENRTQLLFTEHLFQKNPYGHPVNGTPETLKNLYLRDVKIQYRKLMIPNQAFLAIAFSGDREDLFRRQSRRWGAWVRDKAAPFTFRKSTPPERPRILIVDEPNVENSFLRWGYIGVARSSRDFLMFQILEEYLTLWLPTWAEEISANSQIRGCPKLAERRMPGYLQVSLEAPAESITLYYEKLRSSLAELREGEVNAGQFEEAKQLVFRRFEEAFDDPVEQMKLTLGAELYGLGVNYISTLKLRLERVTQEAFQERLVELLPEDRFVMIVAGEAEKLEPYFSGIGEVELLN
jgi:zinc protease